MGIEDKKSEGGEKLDQEAIRNIAVAVKALIDEDKEKGKTTQDLGVIRSEVGELKGQLAQVQKALYCTKDGKICFNTPEELNAFMEKQEKIIQGLDGKVTQIVEKFKGLDEVAKKQTLPGGVQRLPDITAEIRAGMSKEDDEARDGEVKAIADYFHVSDNDLYKKIEKVGANLDAIAKKKNMRERVLSSLSDEERKKVVLYGCKDGECKVWRENMEKEEGVKFYLKDERGKFRPVDQPKKEESHF